MISGDHVQVLEARTPLRRNRELMGATDPKKAKRARSAPILPRASTQRGTRSDGPKPARTEIAYFFPASEIFSR